MPDAHDVNDHKVRGDLLTADDWNALARLAKYDPPQSGDDELIPFELYDDIAPSETDKDAWILKADLTRDTDADKIHVSDGILGDVRALGSNTKTGGTPATGARGYAVVGPDGDNQIVSIQRLANSCRAVAKGAIAGSTGTVDAVTVMDDGQSPVANTTTAELAVTNPWNFYLADNALCQIIRNGSGWDITNTPLVTQDFDTGNDVDGLNLTHTWREVRVNATETEQGPTSWHLGDDCSA